MKPMVKFIGFDLGASNGRAIAGLFDGEKLSLETIHQFWNGYVRINDSLHWDVLRLFSELQTGLGVFADKFGGGPESVGIDTWGVDYGLLDKSGCLIGNPYHYRDSRTEGVLEEIDKAVGGYEVFRTTGTAPWPGCTLSQLYSMVMRKSPQLEIADRLLMTPSLLAYFLTGEKFEEHSIITTSCLYNVEKSSPAAEILERLRIPQIMCEVVMPGTVFGTLRRSLAGELGLGSVPVVAAASHDSASAAVSVPAAPDTNWAFISSGTWSVMGVESERPITTRSAYEMGFTNESTADGRFMTVSNITALWIVQECKRIWDKEGDALSWQEIVRLAEDARPFSAFIDVDDSAFVNPLNMPEAIAERCRSTSQQAPQSKGALARVAFESLALKYRDVVRKLEELTGRRIEVLHIVGGGARNELLCQFTANATGLPVLAGPYEATASGNILMQMIGKRMLESVMQGRDLLRRSVDLVEYQPRDVEIWSEAYDRYQRLLNSTLSRTS